MRKQSVNHLKDCWRTFQNLESHEAEFLPLKTKNMLLIILFCLDYQHEAAKENKSSVLNKGEYIYLGLEYQNQKIGWGPTWPC